MLKRTLVVLGAINLILLCSVCWLGFLAWVSPCHPGDFCFSSQQTAETWRIRLTSGDAHKADLALDIVERRLDSLAQVDSRDCAQDGLEGLNQAIDAYFFYREGVEGAAGINLTDKFITLLVQADVVLSGLEKESSYAACLDVIQEIQVKVVKFLSKVQMGEEVALPRLENTLGEFVPISFLGYEVDHSIYPLEGGHEAVGCETCHTDGEYAYTPTTCEDCHRFDFEHKKIQEFSDQKMAFIAFYPEDPNAECEDCHTVADREPTHYHHVGVNACRGCHEDDSLVIHYPGDCLDCHQDTEIWAVADYDHTWNKDCEACHAIDAPPFAFAQSCSRCHVVEEWSSDAFQKTTPRNTCLMIENDTHYPGDCLACHNTKSWRYPRFDHSGYRNCVSCHLLDIPDRHLGGQCTQCHVTADWDTIIFEHEGYPNCIGCHGGLAPVPHYAGQCSRCHKISNWFDASFSHHGFPDCKECHSAPSGHFSGQCSDCHNKYNWRSRAVDHTGSTSCSDCHAGIAPAGHFPGSCNNCHNTNTWSGATVNHTGFNDCMSCHNSPPDHYSGQCSACHNTSNWAVIRFDHSGATNCGSCHNAPSGHWPGQCSDCHNTSNWGQVNFDHQTYTNCNACHARPSGHPRGQCSNCHSSNTWYIPPTPNSAAHGANSPNRHPIAHGDTYTAASNRANSNAEYRPYGNGER